MTAYPCQNPSPQFFIERQNFLRLICFRSPGQLFWNTSSHSRLFQFLKQATTRAPFVQEILNSFQQLIFIHYNSNYQIVQMSPLITLLLCYLLLLQYCLSYLDIPLQVKRTNNYISYTVPMKINGIDYAVSTSLQDGEEFIFSPKDKVKEHNKKNKKHKASKDEAEGMVAVLGASSLEGYSFQGWKRFFLQAFLYIESRYYHEIKIDLKDIKEKKANQLQTRDGLITFGPALVNNKIYQLIKNSTEFIKNDIVSIYRGINDKNVRMQLGGFEQSYARGNRNGILFYEVTIKAQDGKWWLPVKAISCMRERNGKDDVFYIANSDLRLAISIESPYIKLPTKFASELQRNFETVHVSCQINSQQKLSCTNMTSIDLSLNFLQFQIDSGAYINISLYDLRESYDQKTAETVFRIIFVPDSNQLQIGEALFQSYYISIDMGNQNMFFSPINRFPAESYGVYVIRFFLGFGLFMIVSAIGAMIWQTFNDPFRKNKMIYDQDGVRLVQYQRPKEYVVQDM